MAKTIAKQLDKSEFEALLELVARGLNTEIGGNWSVTIPDDFHYACGYLVCNGLQRFWVQNSYPYGKLAISISLDKTEQPTSGRTYGFDALWKESTTAINCGLTKSAGQIAADIKRRLWPSVGKLVDKAREDGENERKRKAYASECMAKLMAAIRDVGDLRKGSSGEPYINLKVGEGYGDIKPAFYSEGNASIQIELRSLDMESAIAVCEALAAIGKGNDN